MNGTLVAGAALGVIASVNFGRSIYAYGQYVDAKNDAIADEIYENDVAPRRITGTGRDLTPVDPQPAFVSPPGGSR